MTTFLLNKKCERCNTPLPDEFVNLLCYDDYNKSIEEAEKRKMELKEQAIAEVKKVPDSQLNNVEEIKPIGDSKPADNIEAFPSAPLVSRFGILDPDYQENPEMDDKDQILANLAQFIGSHRDADNPKGAKHGILLYYPQRNMYSFIKNYCMKKVIAHPQYPKYFWKPKIVDVGCGSGTGANILSQEADFVWGIDKNSFSIEFAKEAFTREKNNIFYSSQLTFDQFNIMEDTRETLKFDIVVAIEVIEHIYDTDKFLRALINKFTKRDKKGNCHILNEPTEFFFSTPNRNFRKIKKDKPDNPYHVREYRSQELVAYLRNYFEEVKIYNQKGEPVPEDTVADEVVLLHCWHPKI